MGSTRNYTALVVKVPDGTYMGIAIEVGGAASFAKTKEELLERLEDAVKCIKESNKVEFKTAFSETLRGFGKVTEELIPCSY